MLKISKLADYAIVVMDVIARQMESLLCAKDIAEQSHIPEPTASKLLKKLAGKGLLKSQRGVRGGYTLAREPSQIFLAEIISAIDGDIALTECHRRPGQCQVESCCAFGHNWQRISQAMTNVLAEISLADMRQPIPKKMIHLNFKRHLNKSHSHE